jgi:hypothetical protein
MYRKERQFGLLMAGILALITGWILWRHALFVDWLAAIAAAFAFTALIVPRVLVPVLAVWLRIGHWLAIVNGTLILTLVFLLVLTPIALVMRLTGHDALARRRKATGSYWLAHDGRPDKDSFRRQF